VGTAWCRAIASPAVASLLRQRRAVDAPGLRRKSRATQCFGWTPPSTEQAPWTPEAAGDLPKRLVPTRTHPNISGGSTPDPGPTGGPGCPAVSISGGGKACCLEYLEGAPDVGPRLTPTLFARGGSRFEPMCHCPMT
jgi:hypothetical protein